MTASFELAPPFAPLASTDILEADQVTQEDLLRLAAGEAIAIVVRGFADANHCARVAEQLLTDSRYKEYENLAGVHMWGLNSSESLSNPDGEEQYFSNAMPTVWALRSI